MDDNVSPEPSQIVEEVEGEAIVVVDQDDHGAPVARVYGAPSGGSRSPLFPWLLRTFGSAGKTARFFRRTKQGLRLVDAFLLLEIGIAVGHDACACLNVHRAVLDQRGPQNDAGVHFARSGKIPDTAGVQTALFFLQLI